MGGTWIEKNVLELPNGTRMVVSPDAIVAQEPCRYFYQPLPGTTLIGPIILFVRGDWKAGRPHDGG